MANSSGRHKCLYGEGLWGSGAKPKNESGTKIIKRNQYRLLINEKSGNFIFLIVTAAAWKWKRSYMK